MTGFDSEKDAWPSPLRCLGLWVLRHGVSYPTDPSRVVIGGQSVPPGGIKRGDYS